jgi:5-formyltetrahydrofolate cyclo-ligase
MSNKNSLATTITVPTDLWNKAQKTMQKEGINNFSYFAQKSIRSYIQTLEERNIKEFLDQLNEKGKQTLIKEMKKRSF